MINYGENYGKFWVNLGKIVNKLGWDIGGKVLGNIVGKLAKVGDNLGKIWGNLVEIMDFHKDYKGSWADFELL